MNVQLSTNKPHLWPFDNVSRSSRRLCITHPIQTGPGACHSLMFSSASAGTCSDLHSLRQIKDGWIQSLSQPVSDHRHGTVDACSTCRPGQEYQRWGCFGRGNNEHCLMLAGVALAAMWKGAAGGLGFLDLRMNHVLLNAYLFILLVCSVIKMTRLRCIYQTATAV